MKTHAELNADHVIWLGETIEAITFAVKREANGYGLEFREDKIKEKGFDPSPFILYIQMDGGRVRVSREKSDRYYSLYTLSSEDLLMLLYGLDNDCYGSQNVTFYSW